MRRSALVLSVLAWASLWVGSAAGAVSLSLTTDKSVYTTGESIEITLVADTTGGDPDVGVFLVVGFSDPTLVDGVGAVATQSTAITSLGGQLTWNKQNPACRFDRCTILNQITGIPQPIEPDPMIVIGTLTLPTIAPGVLTLDPGVENIILFFGAPMPPPITVTIVGDPIVDPDPDPVDPGPDPIDPDPDPIDPGPGPVDPGSAAPEPSAAVVFGIGLLGLALRMRGRG